MFVYRELRHRTRNAVVPAICLVLLAYFAFHTINGDRGLMAFWQLSRNIGEVRQALDSVDARYDDLQRRVSLMRPDALDRDMLDEQARRVLMLARPDERILLSD